MNPTLASLVADVYTLTNRPDLVGETLLAVKNATLKAHRIDYFYKDIFETGVQCISAQNQQSIEYRTLIPNWRSLKYLRPYVTDGSSGEAKDFLEVLSPEAVLDDYGITKKNICYVAGAEIQLSTLEAYQYYLLGCYVFPNVTDDGFNSWIANENSAAIVYAAAAIVFKTIGYDEQNAAYQQLVQDEYATLKETNIIAVGY